MRSKKELKKLEQNKNKNLNFLARKRRSCKSCFWKPVKAFRFIRGEGWWQGSDSSCCCFRVMNGKKRCFLTFISGCSAEATYRLKWVSKDNDKSSFKLSLLLVWSRKVSWARTDQFINTVLARNHYVIRVLLNTNLLLSSLSTGMVESRWWPGMV